MSMEAFQKLLYDMFCMWHDVRRHYDPPLIEDQQQKMQKVRNMIGKFLTEVDARINRMTPLVEGAADNDWTQEQFEEWAMLTWNLLCVTSRLQTALYTNDASRAFVSSDDKHVLMKLNEVLVQLVNLARPIRPPHGVAEDDPNYQNFFQLFSQTLHSLHQFYVELKSDTKEGESAEEFVLKLHTFGDLELRPCIDSFKEFCNLRCVGLWRNVRAAQIQRMMDYQPLPDEPVDKLVAFYSNMVYTLAIIAARLQGVRYEALTGKGVFAQFFDPVQPLSEMVFSALELLMSDCVLATEPSTNAILVTNNLFAMNCGALARGVVFRDFGCQVVSEETAAQIQAEMKRQKMLQQPTTIGEFSSAALLAMKPTSGVKRCNSSGEGTASNTAHKKSDVNSKDVVVIYPAFNAKYKFWAASYPHLLCTTRQKSRHSTSHQDLSPGALNDSKTGQIGKRPIFYFHIQATMFSPSGRFATAHTLSLPFTIATRRNQDCQVQRMMSSYTATCFWIYGTNIQDGLLLNWADTGMHWDHFKHLYSQHFKVNADVSRGLVDRDFVLLQYKLQCQDCAPGGVGGLSWKSGAQRLITFKNALCPHLRYECGATNVRFSVWRGMLELLQIFQDSRTNVRQLWENGLLLGLLEFDQVAELLKPHESALIMRLSFVTGGSICITVRSNAHALGPGATAPMHLEPLDLKRLQAKSLQEYLRDIAIAERVKYILNANLELVKVSDVLEQFNLRLNTNGPDASSRDILSNVTHTGDIDAMQHIKFTALRIAVVTCKVKPPSSDNSIELEQEAPRKLSNGYLTPNGTVDFADELAHLMAKYGKTKQDAIDIISNFPKYS